jgi:DnaJ-like protein
MTERKPPSKSWKSFVEDQIQEAQRAGEFDQLEGKGKPIPGIEAPYDPLWWVKKLLEREKLSVLPPALEIRARVDRAIESLWTLRSEDHVRERVAVINRDIALANRTAAAGPPTTLSPLDVEDVVARWRARRAHDHPAQRKESR